MDKITSQINIYPVFWLSDLTHPAQQPTADWFKKTINLAKSVRPALLNTSGWIRRASTDNGKTPFDKANFVSSYVSAKFHKQERHLYWRRSCPWSKWCFKWFRVRNITTSIGLWASLKAKVSIKEVILEKKSTSYRELYIL